MRKRELTEKDIQDIIKYYKDHSRNNTCKEFKIGESRLQKILIANNIQIHTKEENIAFGKAHAILTSLEHFGTEYPTQSKVVREKTRQTNIAKFGVDVPAKSKEVQQKMMDTCNERYGVSYYFQSDDCKEKSKKTCNERYGVDYTGQAQIKKDNTKKTFKERYGTECALQVEEFKNKEEQTNMERYGVKYYFQSEDYKEKSKKTCNKRYNTDFYSSTDLYKESYKKTCNERYGVDNVFAADFCKEKMKSTNKEKYGVEYAGQIESAKEKAKQTNKEKYGVEYISQSHEIRSRMRTHYKYNDINFDSSWELALWIYAKDHDEEIERCPCYFDYYIEDKLHKYFPDFKYNGKLIEIKGDQFFNDDGSFAGGKEKYACMIDNNITIWKWNDIKFAINYIKATYGKNYLKQFKNK